MPTDCLYIAFILQEHRNLVHMTISLFCFSPGLVAACEDMANKQKAHSTVHGQPFGGITEQVTGAWPRNIDIGRRPDSFFQLLAERLSFLGLSVTEVIETRLIMCLFTVLSFDAAMIFFLYLFLLYFLASFMSNFIILIFIKKTQKCQSLETTYRSWFCPYLQNDFPKYFSFWCLTIHWWFVLVIATHPDTSSPQPHFVFDFLIESGNKNTNKESLTTRVRPSV